MESIQTQPSISTRRRGRPANDTKPVQIRLTDAQVLKLDDLAIARGKNRSEIIRELVNAL